MRINRCINSSWCWEGGRSAGIGYRRLWGKAIRFGEARFCQPDYRRVDNAPIRSPTHCPTLGLNRVFSDGRHGRYMIQYSGQRAAVRPSFRARHRAYTQTTAARRSLPLLSTQPRKLEKQPFKSIIYPWSIRWIWKYRPSKNLLN